MSRKIRVAKTQITALPTAAWTFDLLTGAPAEVRIHGWVCHAQAGHHGEPTYGEVWAQHRDALLEEAEANGFVPYAKTKRVPTGQGYEAWVKKFLAANT